jgi:hypothetical protein
MLTQNVKPQARWPPLPFYSPRAEVTRGVHADQLGWSSSIKLWLQYFGTKSEALQCYYNNVQHGIIMTSDITVLSQSLSICLVTLSPLR